MNSESAGQPTVIEQPSVNLAGSIFATAFLGVVFLFLLVVALGVLLTGNLLGLFLLAAAGFLGVLVLYVLRDTRGKIGWRMEIGAHSVGLDLPRGRSLIHQLAPVHTTIPYDDIDTIETRLEAYPGFFGLTNMHRSYALKLKAGDVIILGEDRALHTALESSLMRGAVEEIVRRSDLPMRDLGMAEGRPGFLSLLFTAPPSWDAPSLDPERQKELWAAAERTGRLAGVGGFVTLISRPK